jgi:hypothetical protein
MLMSGDDVQDGSFRDDGEDLGAIRAKRKCKEPQESGDWYRETLRMQFAICVTNLCIHPGVAAGDDSSALGHQYSVYQ